MQTAIQQTFSNTHVGVAPKTSVLTRFFNWSAGQEHSRYGWLGGILAAQGCVVTPLTMFAIVLSGNNIIFWMVAIVSIMMTLVTNLAAMPMKITIPVFVLSVLIDIVLIAACVVTGFQFGA